MPSGICTVTRETSGYGWVTLCDTNAKREAQGVIGSFAHEPDEAQATANMSIDTTLTCCNDKQLMSIFLIVIYAIVIFKLCVEPACLSGCLHENGVRELTHCALGLQLAPFNPASVQDPVRGSAALWPVWRNARLTSLFRSTVFLHELGHATAAWLTCGSVRGPRALDPT